MNPKLRRSLPPLWLIVTLTACELWMWSFDHLPRWAAFLVLLGILGSVLVMGRYLQRRREAREARDAAAGRRE